MAMPKPTGTTKARILNAAYALFYRKGFARVSVDAIADRAGVTKRTLYYHFESKDALAAAALDVQHALAFTQMTEWRLQRAKTAEDLARLLFAELSSWASQEGWAGSGFTRLAMELAGLPGHPARSAASRHKAKVEDFLSARLRAITNERAPNLARQILILMEGSMSLALIHGDIGYIDEAKSKAVDLMR